MKFKVMWNNEHKGMGKRRSGNFLLRYMGK